MLVISDNNTKLYNYDNVQKERMKYPDYTCIFHFPENKKVQMEFTKALILYKNNVTNLLDHALFIKVDHSLKEVHINVVPIPESA